MSNDIKPGALNQRLFDWHIKTVSYTPGGCQRGEHSIAFWIAFLETILTGMALERQGFVVFLHCIGCEICSRPARSATLFSLTLFRGGEQHHQNWKALPGEQRVLDKPHK